MDDNNKKSQLLVAQLNQLYSKPIVVDTKVHKEKTDPNIKLHSIYENYTVGNTTAAPERNESKIPINLMILFALFLAATYLFTVEKYEVIHSALPKKYQPLFEKWVGPLADEKPVQARQTAQQIQQQKEQQSNIAARQSNSETTEGTNYGNATATQENSDKYIKIDGTLVKYNPSGQYWVNGKMVIYHPKPGSNH